MNIDIRPITSESVEDLASVFCGDASAEGCWCMWFIVPVKDYHASGTDGNRSALTEIIQTSAEPVGLIAYDDEQPVGWMAIGPRARYARAIKTPTYRGRYTEQDEDTWLVPCFYVRPEIRSSGLMKKLLQAGVDVARNSRAHAIEGFPYTGHKKRSRDTQVGFHSVFEALGFDVVATPSDQRVVVRLELKGSA